MKLLKKGLVLVFALLILIVIAAVVLVNPFGPSPVNNYIRQGELKVAGLKQPVRVCRDEKGMPYIYAADMQDLWFAQGFVTAQDRLFQMELIRLMAMGRIGELAGASARDLDVRMRTLGFHRQAEKKFRQLNRESRSLLQKYVEGINAMMAVRPQDIHLEFKLAGIQPSPWRPEDPLAIAYYMGWNSAGNLQNEIVSQMLIETLGLERASELFPLNVHPDESFEGTAWALRSPGVFLGDNHLDRLLAFTQDRALQAGSNNWVVAAARSAGAKPILANDPHLEAAMLPGPWYMSGLIAPNIRAVGVTIPGIPGMLGGRTDHVAFGMTNAYGDTQDLYVETIDPADPGRYMEGAQSIPFEVFEEVFRFKTKDAPEGYTSETVRVRATRRGPVISEVLPVGRGSGTVVTVRWSAFESIGDSVGFERFLTSRNSGEFREALQEVHLISLNYVFADQDGRIGWHVTGPVPIRGNGEGRIPHVVRDGDDNWRGWIAFDQMPHADHPESDWLGTTNHKTITGDYPYYFSDFFSTPFRQRRLMQLMADETPTTVEAHWEYQRDVVNLKAARVAPIMSRALLGYRETARVGSILESWDHRDSSDQAAPTLFHAIFNEFAYLMLVDELGQDAVRRLLSNTYYWEQRVIALIEAGESDWFDDVRTPDTVETQEMLWHKAALNVIARLKPELGSDPSSWQWGRIHRYEFISPIARKGVAKRWLGGGKHPAEGSGDTLSRAKPDHHDISTISYMPSLRMVVDLGDPDKVAAVVPGGVTGRQFHPHYKDQILPFLRGEMVYWWFSDQAIKDNTRHELMLEPSIIN
jgi:penicillin G amidase